MKPGFDKGFADLQTGLVSLCLEAVHQKVRTVYAYGFIDEGAFMFNAFFDVKGEIIGANRLISDKNVLMQVYKLGTADLVKLSDLCKENEVPCPLEIKMVYDCKKKHFESDCVYEKTDPDMNAHEAFLNWQNEIAAGCSEKPGKKESGDHGKERFKGWFK